MARTIASFATLISRYFPPQNPYLLRCVVLNLPSWPCCSFCLECSSFISLSSEMLLMFSQSTQMPYSLRLLVIFLGEQLPKEDAFPSLLGDQRRFHRDLLTSNLPFGGGGGMLLTSRWQEKGLAPVCATAFPALLKNRLGRYVLRPVKIFERRGTI